MPGEKIYGILLVCICGTEYGANTGAKDRPFFFGGCLKDWAKEFYGSKRWHATRRAYLRSVHGLCERCLAKGLVIPAKIVHHKEYLTEQNIHDAEVSLNHDKLEALCQDCHNDEHHTRTKDRYTFDENGNVIPPSKR